MASSAANKKLQMVAVLCLAFVMAAVAADVKHKCVPPNSDDWTCVTSLRRRTREKNQGRKLLFPDCCKQEQFGCACVLGNALREANLLDIQKP
ncbi:unnamed protein product [Urochloa decumbens]|uniref:Uncharacterized protein n=1 Tax=Urochloa decumbens TaxID=240449 RepID=A0ABC9DC89_9POAL